MREAATTVNAESRRKRKHEKSNSALLEEISWTATRCSRLLRSIESRVAILRRISRNTALAEVDAKGCRQQDVPRRARYGERSENSGAQLMTTTSQDPIWVSEIQNGHVAQLKTYNDRRRLPADARLGQLRQEPKLGPLQFSSPVLQRFRSETSEETSEIARNSASGLASFSRKRKLQRSYGKSVSEAEETERQLEMALTNVLVATQARSKLQSHGVSSLKSLCLRHVHSCIQLENEVLNEDSGESNNDCTFEIYSSLETLGSGKGNGWRGLREVVRGHVISLVCSAIGDRLLSSLSIERLLDICTTNQEVSGAQRMIVSWISSSPTPNPHQLSVFEVFSKKQECYGFFLRTWQTLNLQDHTLLRRHIRKPGFDDMILKSLMEAPGLEASEFLRHCISPSESVSRSDTETLSISALDDPSVLESTITRIAIIAAACVVAPYAQCRKTLMYEHVFRAAVAIDLVPSRMMKTAPIRRSKRIQLVALTLMALHQDQQPELALGNIIVPWKCLFEIPSTSNNPESCEDHDAEAELAREFAEGVLSLECSLRLALVKHVIARLTSFDDNSPTVRGLVQKIKLELACAASRSVYSAQDDPALMEEISKIMMARSNSRVTLRTPDVKASLRNLRWEESICEWMLTTPLGSGAVDNDDAQEQHGTDGLTNAIQHDQPEVALSSPDILDCSPYFKPGKDESDSPSRSLSRRTKSIKLRTPMKSQSRRSLPEYLPTESPDVIALGQDFSREQGGIKSRSKRLRFSLPDLPAHSEPRSNKMKHARDQRHTIAQAGISTDVISDDELA